ncbi:arabinan endo-1,5-alpha-L-arabinosidase [Dyadobacter fermentans]|uniref:Arabinan endo-1,5-alpha-L-arabinosidase n=1 Tax=Dyadobacter fermentans (strain ATCC 700827 / DSM 18053 / CIP 107007 / KCTC 52180 / NS114) TaxID=471854 RepID=C6W131_DYAFD|nr:arabinan endo-1,5-alpha-L-arabinosidase [Dyadobacter fermentans]ACT95486.1 Arabinan endo-1,5-alpha-L-arabinosidase [Dyadobacter fermentans DSM 18053]
MRLAILLLFILGAPMSRAQDSLQTNIPVHDPVMIRQNGTYYLFATGRGIAMWSSKDMQNWKKEKPVFSAPPGWAMKAVPGFRGHIWAPDISLYNGVYHLYYSISTFGKNRSCIGLATNKTLDPASPDYRWTDHGALIESVPGRDEWNAIDPNLIVDDQQHPWLSFGSFWNGIKVVKLTADARSIAQPQTWFTLASVPRTKPGSDSTAGNGAIEAPFIFKKTDYYYLFASYDYCCRGEKSTYKMRVGRSKTLTGPYLDQTGQPMTQGGGTLLLEGNAEWHGVGHNAVCTFDGADYLVFHGYDAKDKGRSKLRVEPLDWQGDWPALRTR